MEATAATLESKQPVYLAPTVLGDRLTRHRALPEAAVQTLQQLHCVMLEHSAYLDQLQHRHAHLVPIVLPGRLRHHYVQLEAIVLILLPLRVVVLGPTVLLG
jgi:hypothetical protein